MLHMVNCCLFIKFSTLVVCMAYVFGDEYSSRETYLAFFFFLERVTIYIWVRFSLFFYLLPLPFWQTQYWGSFQIIYMYKFICTWPHMYLYCGKCLLVIWFNINKSTSVMEVCVSSGMKRDCFAYKDFEWLCSGVSFGPKIWVLTYEIKKKAQLWPRPTPRTLPEGLNFLEMTYFSWQVVKSAQLGSDEVSFWS